MREILFRGKQIDNGEWAYGSFFPDVREGCNDDKIFDGFIKPFGKTKEERMMVEVDRSTVGQYTGICDKNGTKIFEGDIVRGKDVIHDGEIQIKGEKYVVEFQKGCWTIRAEDDCWDFLCTQDDLEVIGNIHDNPELLKNG